MFFPRCIVLLTLVSLLLVPGSGGAYDPIPMTPRTLAEAGLAPLPYALVYVRSPRTLPCTTSCPKPGRWAEFANPYNVNAGTDLMLLHPDGTEEVLVAGGPGAVQDPYVSFDGETVYYTLFHGAGDLKAGADIYTIHIPTRQVTRLTHQSWAHPKGVIPPYGVFNMHPCPVPGGKIAFVSNRNGFLPPPKNYPRHLLQLHVMDTTGANIETIGHLNLAGALHPTILTDGRLLFSSLESMGLRNHILWGLWTLWPDGSNWGPVASAFWGPSAPPGAHFQTQRSDGTLEFILYYNQNQKGFGALFSIPPCAGTCFGPADRTDPRTTPFQFTGQSQATTYPFTPTGMQLRTPWSSGDDKEALQQPDGTWLGKVTHPSGAPDNHTLLVYSPTAIKRGGALLDSGIYLAPPGVIADPGSLILLKNDPQYNEQWPRALVPYARIYGMATPPVLRSVQDPRIPEGAPFGLVGTSSVYKRESSPRGVIGEGDVTAWQEHLGVTGPTSPGKWNWFGQGSDAGKYSNAEIHSVRIVTFEPNAVKTERTSVSGTPHFPDYQQTAIGKTLVPMERLRILGDIPVRKYHPDGSPVLDPDGNPDTSFLAVIPADVPFTFQTIDKDGLVLNMAQTWHQVRPGEARTDCGGCHAHSQPPTLFEETAAGQPGYVPIDLTGVGIATTYTREQHIPQGIQIRMDDPTHVTPLQSRCSPAMWLLRGEAKDCPGVEPLPAGTVLSDHQRTAEELHDMAALIDTGACMGPACTEDATRPTLVVTRPQPGANVGPLTQIRLGAHDYVSNLNMGSLQVVLNGTEMAERCQPLPDYRWECPLPASNTELAQGTLLVSIADTVGNVTTIDRTFSVQAPSPPPPPPHAEQQWTLPGATMACQTDGPDALALLTQVDACLTPASPPPLPPLDRESQAIEALTALGGRVTYGPTPAGRRVIGANLHGSQARDADLVHLSAFPYLTSLSINRLPITDAGMPHVCQIGMLTHLYMHGTKTTNAGLACLSAVPVQHLQLPSNNYTAPGMCHLAQVHTLQYLDIEGINVGDAGIACLAPLVNMRVLLASVTRSGDASIAAVAAMTRLEGLALDWNPQLTDAGLAQLHGLTALKHLRLKKTRVTDAGVQALQQALPKVKVAR